MTTHPCPGCGTPLCLSRFSETLPPLFRLCDRCATRGPEGRQPPATPRPDLVTRVRIGICGVALVTALVIWLVCG